MGNNFEITKFIEKNIPNKFPCFLSLFDNNLFYEERFHTQHRDTVAMFKIRTDAVSILSAVYFPLKLQVKTGSHFSYITISVVSEKTYDTLLLPDIILSEKGNYISESRNILITDTLNRTMHEKIKTIQTFSPDFSKFILMNIDLFGS